jgi:signal transduction histidine kinase/CheY-like chemotaxis protein
MAGVLMSGLLTLLVTLWVRRRIERDQALQHQIQTQKLEALGQLAGGIAHDFNNLLGAILGFAHFLVQDTPEDSPQRRYAERVVMAGQRGRGLVQQILTFTRRASGEPANVAIAEIVHETIDLLRATIPSSTNLVVDSTGGSLVVTADRSQLGQVLVNLCINASDALEGRPGEVHVAVEAVDQNRPELKQLPVCATKPTPSIRSMWTDDAGFDWIGTGGLTSHENVSIRVADTGAGIARSHYDLLFDLFFTTKRNSGGSGLGLPIVQRIVTEHGGAILVRTKVGHGTAFEVVLPRSRSQAIYEEDTVAIAGVPCHHSATILVIDDDEDFCDMVQTALHRLGHEAVSVGDPLEGLAAVQENPSLWDMVVTDQTMPHMKGTELVRRVKATSSAIRCIICTGYSSSLDEPEAIAAGADGFRTKPLDLRDFGALVNRLLDSSPGPGDPKA